MDGWLLVPILAAIGGCGLLPDDKDSADTGERYDDLPPDFMDGPIGPCDWGSFQYCDTGTGDTGTSETGSPPVTGGSGYPQTETSDTGSVGSTGDTGTYVRPQAQ